MNYLSQEAAQAANLISTSDDSIIMVRGYPTPHDAEIILFTLSVTQKVDNTTKLDAGKFRDSVRIHSKTPMKIGSILIADFIKMPFGCATWPGPSASSRGKNCGRR